MRERTVSTLLHDVLSKQDMVSKLNFQKAAPFTTNSSVPERDIERRADLCYFSGH